MTARMCSMLATGLGVGWVTWRSCSPDEVSGRQGRWNQDRCGGKRGDSFPVGDVRHELNTISACDEEMSDTLRPVALSTSCPVAGYPGAEPGRCERL